MNAPETLFNSLSSQVPQATLHTLALVCRDGAINLKPGMIFWPLEAAQKNLDRYWREHYPPKPPHPPRFLPVEVTTFNVLALPAARVREDAMRGAELLALISDAYAPPLAWASPDEVAKITETGSTGKLQDSELLRRCFAHLAARGLDALEIPISGHGRATGLILFDLRQIHPTGEVVEIIRDFDNCFGYSWQKIKGSAGELTGLAQQLHRPV